MPGRLNLDDAPIARIERDGAGARRDRASVCFVEHLPQIRGNEVDDLLFLSLGRGQSRALAHGFFRPIGIPASELGKAAKV